MGKGTASKWLSTRRVLMVVGGIVALAVVIFAVSAISSPKKPDTSSVSTSELSPTAQAAQLADQAQAAESRNDTQTALVLAKSALKLDPANIVAKKIIANLDKTAASAKSAANNPGTAAPAPSGAAAATVTAAPYAPAIANVGELLPASIAEWTGGSRVIRAGEGLVTFEPKGGTSGYRSVVRATFSVHDLTSVSAASAFIGKVDKALYTVGATTMQVGAVSGYYGTDGKQLTAVAFARGRYAFEVVLYGRPSAQAPTLKSLSVKLAGSFPATH